MYEIIKEIATKMLGTLGVEPQSSDELDVYIYLAQESLKFYLTVDELPENIEYLWAEITAGRYIKSSYFIEDKSSGTIKSVKEGNISITYDNYSSIWDKASEMCEITEYKLAPFRRIIW